MVRHSSYPRNCGTNPDQLGLRPRGAASTTTLRSEWTTALATQALPPSRKQLTCSTSLSTNPCSRDPTARPAWVTTVYSWGVLNTA